MPVRQGSICDSRRAGAACGVHVPRLPARGGRAASRVGGGRRRQIARHRRGDQPQFFRRRADRKSTRLNPVTNAHLVCRLLLEKKKKNKKQTTNTKDRKIK